MIGGIVLCVKCVIFAIPLVLHLLTLSGAAVGHGVGALGVRDAAAAPELGEGVGHRVLGLVPGRGGVALLLILLQQVAGARCKYFCINVL